VFITRGDNILLHKHENFQIEPSRNSHRERPGLAPRLILPA
jgi:hypothetical protein